MSNSFVAPQEVKLCIFGQKGKFSSPAFFMSLTHRIYITHMTKTSSPTGVFGDLNAGGANSEQGEKYELSISSTLKSIGKGNSMEEMECKGVNGVNVSGNKKESIQQLTSVRSLWITNVAMNTRARDIKSALSKYGKVVGTKIVVNAKYPGTCCFGYVTMGSPEDATAVIQNLNNTELKGQIIKIEKFDTVRSKKMRQTKCSDTSTSDNAKTTKIEADSVKSKSHSQNYDSSKINSSCYASRTGSSERSEEMGERRNKESDRSKKQCGSARERSRSRNSHEKRQSEILTFEKIKEARERQRIREKQRILREEARKKHEETVRQRETDRRQRSEAHRLEREKERLRIEREKIEREKSELIRLERDRQHFERERIEFEKNNLRRAKKQHGSPCRDDELYSDRYSRDERNRDYTLASPILDFPSGHLRPSRVPTSYHNPYCVKTARVPKTYQTKDYKLPNKRHHSLEKIMSDSEYEPPYKSSTSINKLDISSRSSSKSRKEKETGEADHHCSSSVNSKIIDSRVEHSRRHHITESDSKSTWESSSKISSKSSKWSTKNECWGHGSDGRRWSVSNGDPRVYHRRSSQNTNYSCPPPPGLKSYPDNLTYTGKSSSSSRKY